MRNPIEYKILSSTVYELVFKDKEEVYPNILLRDFFRGIIEFPCLRL